MELPAPLVEKHWEERGFTDAEWEVFLKVYRCLHYKVSKKDPVMKELAKTKQKVKSVFKERSKMVLSGTGIRLVRRLKLEDQWEECERYASRVKAMEGCSQAAPAEAAPAEAAPAEAAPAEAAPVEAAPAPAPAEAASSVGEGTASEAAPGFPSYPSIDSPACSSLIDPVSKERCTTQEPYRCHNCCKAFTEVHFFYDKLCGRCAGLNWEQRNLTRDLKNKVALVTGGRIKIGYQIVLKLLRCGATVYATTRFTVDAAERFSREPDYDEWSSRLQVC